MLEIYGDLAILSGDSPTVKSLPRGISSDDIDWPTLSSNSSDNIGNNDLDTDEERNNADLDLSNSCNNKSKNTYPLPPLLDNKHKQ